MKSEQEIRERLEMLESHWPTDELVYEETIDALKWVLDDE